MQQHSHQLAWALNERHLLEQYVSGIPVIEFGEPAPFWLPPTLARRVKRVGVPRARRRHPIVFPVAIKIMSALSSASGKDDNVHRVFHAFDWWSSLIVARTRPDVVVGYENSSNMTFRAAKKVGALCILDLPSIEHSAAKRLLGYRESRYSAVINKRKDEEISQADLLVTCSDLAAQSYRQAGVPEAKIKTMLLGAEPVVSSSRRIGRSGPVRFIFAGTMSRRKSIDLILAVLDRLNEVGLVATLVVAGGAEEQTFLDQVKNRPYVTYRGQLSQPELQEAFLNVDCLLLPSRFDAFGMVVVEAMAQGTPAVVSTMTGAREIFAEHPDAGWTIAPDENSLFLCLQNLCLHPDLLDRAREPAMRAAASFTWQSYRSKVGGFIENWVFERRTNNPAPCTS